MDAIAGDDLAPINSRRKQDRQSTKHPSSLPRCILASRIHGMLYVTIPFDQ
jgi:hypothetical protein